MNLGEVLASKAYRLDSELTAAEYRLRQIRKVCTDPEQNARVISVWDEEARSWRDATDEDRAKARQETWTPERKRKETLKAKLEVIDLTLRLLEAMREKGVFES